MRTGLLQPEPVRSERHRSATRCGFCEESAGEESLGRSETKSMKEPSGAMPGEESEYSPENGAT
jgi:hypothetical protein